jgi:hypothetical protein
MRTIPLSSFATAIAMSAIEAGAQSPPAIEQVAWLTGCWVADGAEAGSDEHWLAPAAGTMFGVNRTVRGARLSQFEFMAIRTRADGRLVFIALPGGKNETEFGQMALSAEEAVFESPREAFPSRVIYRRTGARTMLGRIEGLANGVPRAVDLAFTRVSCPQRP